jgi:hypothetical protein
LFFNLFVQKVKKASLTLCTRLGLDNIEEASGGTLSRYCPMPHGPSVMRPSYAAYQVY